jgi:hypothetical protein
MSGALNLCLQGGDRDSFSFLSHKIPISGKMFSHSTNAQSKACKSSRICRYATRTVHFADIRNFCLLSCRFLCVFNGINVEVQF